jgi:hypothetical protein
MGTAQAAADTAFRFAVPLFILVLGYMTYTKYLSITGFAGWSVFFLDKLRLVLWFIGWSAVYTASHHPLPKLAEVPPIQFTSFLWGNAEVHLYYLIAYFGFLVLTPAVAGGIRLLPPGWRMPVFLLAAGMHILLMTESVRDIYAGRLDTFYISTLSHLPLHWFGFYAIGLASACWRERFGKKILTLTSDWLLSSSIGVALGLIFLLTVGFAVHRQMYLYIYYTPYLYALLIVSIGLCSWLYMRMGATHLRAAVCRLGSYSFPVYLSHILWLKIMVLALGGIVASWIQATAVISTVLLASILYIPAHKRIEHVVIRRIHAIWPFRSNYES